MKVRWTSGAAQALEQIGAHEAGLEAALRLVQRINRAVQNTATKMQ